jgi:hypothetical protein
MPHANLLIGTDVLSRYGVILDLSDAPYLVLDPVEGAARPEGAPQPADTAQPAKADAGPPKGDAAPEKPADH